MGLKQETIDADKEAAGLDGGEVAALRGSVVDVWFETGLPDSITPSDAPNRT